MRHVSVVIASAAVAVILGGCATAPGAHARWHTGWDKPGMTGEAFEMDVRDCDREVFVSVARAYDALGKVCAEAGPLDEKTRELIKLGMAIGGRLEGAVHAHARRALAAGASPADIRHVVAMAVPTVGFPTTVAAFTWVDDVLTPKGKKNARR